MDPTPHRLKLKAQLMLGEEIALGPGKVELLEAIRATGSIAGAARTMGLSYRRAWMMVDTMNRCFKTPLVARTQGGPRGGGAALTSTGEEIVARYRGMEADLGRALEPHAQFLTAQLA